VTRTKSKKYPGVFPHGKGFRGKFTFQRKTYWTDTVSTQKEASELRGPLRIRLERRMPLAPGQLPRTIAPFRDSWLAALRKELGVQKKRGTPENALKQQTINHYADLTKPLADAHPDEFLVDVDAEFALAWLLWPEGPEDKDRRWTHNGVRAMFKFAVLNGLIAVNPFNGLRLRGSKGRADLEVLPNEVFERLADLPPVVYGERYGMMWRAIVLLLGRVGLRPAELYGLRYTDFDFTEGVVSIERQFVHTFGDYDVPKNWQSRTVVVAPEAMDAVRALPRNLDRDAPMWTTKRNKRLHGGNQHYYWNPIRVALGMRYVGMDLYELRHFCGSYLFNDLELPAEAVAQQLGHTDGGALVMKLYGHPDEELQRKRVAAALSARGAMNISSLPTGRPSMGTS
jgi:integrase